MSLFCPCNGSLFLTLLKRTAGFAITRQILWESWPKFKWEWNYCAIYLIWIIKISLSDLNSRRHMQTSFLFERPTALHRVQYDHGHRESHHHLSWRHNCHHHHHFVGVSPIVLRCNGAVTLTVMMKVCVCQQIQKSQKFLRAKQQQSALGQKQSNFRKPFILKKLMEN